MKKESLINQEKETIDSNGKADEKQLQKTIELVEAINGADLKPMWDKWKGTLIDEYKGD